ncbi:polyketide synthase [Micromonospora sp. DT53]|uniref:beta-ketoacyl [acyl carrier protein] synthase domain-containing protein n=1 Tax=Micromonospora sp. DT53 TaxID=3393444 RepID=UPI003CEEEC1C
MLEAIDVLVYMRTVIAQSLSVSPERTSMPDTDAEPNGPLRRAMTTIAALRRQLAAATPDRRIAIVGQAVRAPGGITDVEAYWQALLDRRDLTGEPPSDRRPPGPSEVGPQLPEQGGWLHGALDFDAPFFDMSPREARSTDPQHRLLLEVTWEAFENAGIRPADRGASTGVFVGITGQDYRSWADGEPTAHWTVGNGHSFAAGRLAYTLDFRGPAVALDTACSSSLSALHTACSSLLTGDCEVAVAAAVNLVLSPRSTLEISKTGALSPNARCRPFDALANGFVRGEGCGALVLKRLADAEADGDRILAVVEATALNQDGRSSGFTAPNVAAQARLIEQVLARAGRAPADIGYLETHGTGTSLGDPIELEAVAEALGRRSGGRRLHLGSVKANVGHAEAAAGLLGLIKAVEALRRRQIPPQAQFSTLNPRIDLAGTAMTIPTEPVDWDGELGPCAMVSSFGMSGTNASVILSLRAGADEAGPVAEPAPGLLVSARTEAALAELAGAYAEALASVDVAQYAAFAQTATFGRARHAAAAWVDAADPATAIAGLTALAAGRDDPRVQPLKPDEPVPWTAPARHVATVPTYPWQRTTYSVAAARA